MNQQLILIEQLTPSVANLIVEETNKSSYLSGIFMQADIENGNHRVYPINEIQVAVENINKKIKEGQSIYGELNHPDNLNIDLNNVSHIITEMSMNGSNAMGKAKLINTPKGQIVKAICEAGGKLGVSSRGSGNVVEGKVSGFNLVTIDIVAQPSAPGAYPSHVMEALTTNNKILTLAEAVVNDPKAQKYLKDEVMKLFNSLMGGK